MDAVSECDVCGKYYHLATSTRRPYTGKQCIALLHRWADLPQQY